MSAFTEARMHLGVELRGAGRHPAALRRSGVDPAALVEPSWWTRLVRDAGARGLDLVVLPGAARGCPGRRARRRGDGRADRAVRARHRAGAPGGRRRGRADRAREGDLDVGRRLDRPGRVGAGDLDELGGGRSGRRGRARRRRAAAPPATPAHRRARGRARRARRRRPPRRRGAHRRPQPGRRPRPARAGARRGRGGRTATPTTSPCCSTSRCTSRATRRTHGRRSGSWTAPTSCRRRRCGWSARPWTWPTSSSARWPCAPPTASPSCRSPCPPTCFAITGQVVPLLAGRGLFRTGSPGHAAARPVPAPQAAGRRRGGLVSPRPGSPPHPTRRPCVRRSGHFASGIVVVTATGPDGPARLHLPVVRARCRSTRRW